MSCDPEKDIANSVDLDQTPRSYLHHIHANNVTIIKGSILLKNRLLLIKKTFNKLIYGINTIIICGT